MCHPPHILTLALRPRPPDPRSASRAAASCVKPDGDGTAGGAGGHGEAGKGPAMRLHGSDLAGPAGPGSGSCEPAQCQVLPP